MKRKILSFILIFTVIVAIVNIAHAEGEKGDLSFSSSEPTYSTTTDSWDITRGTYTVSGTAKQNEFIRINGNATLTLNNCTIEKNSELNKRAPAISIESGNVNIVLNGTNTLKGDIGYAGIYVAEGASLTISGSGTLNVTGGDGSDWFDLPDNMQIPSDAKGYCGGGAGIGGNTVFIRSASSERAWVDGTTPSFGNITIESGNITAKGGTSMSLNCAGGAGIGSGGGPATESDNVSLNGEITINGGTINATGGDQNETSLSLGGSGIGSGGVALNMLVYKGNNLAVNIHGGSITATGKGDGAGIGGGNNMDSGIITIDGGTITANGGYEVYTGSQSGFSGGAGIGGGDQAGVQSIAISGGTIVAKAYGAGAGIGAGSDGFVGIPNSDNTEAIYGEITISGNADVTAIGGDFFSNAMGAWFGGAGIGSGVSYNEDNGCGTISITENAKVRAYAGACSQAIGVGAYYGGDAPNKFIVGDKTIDVWMFNKDVEQGAFWGQNEAGTAVTADYSTSGAVAVWYTIDDEDDFPAEGTETDAAVDSETETYKWKYSGNKIQVLKDGEVASEEEAMSGYTFKNWATFVTEPQITISYEFIGDDIPDDLQFETTDTIDKGTEYTPKTIDNLPEGYSFDGWYTDEACTQKFVNGTAVNENISLYGKLTKNKSSDDEEEGEDTPEEDKQDEKEEDKEKSEDSSKAVTTGDKILKYVTIFTAMTLILFIVNKKRYVRRKHSK